MNRTMEDGERRGFEAIGSPAAPLPTPSKPKKKKKPRVNGALKDTGNE